MRQTPIITPAVRSARQAFIASVQQALVESHVPPDEARAHIEHLLSDLWAAVTPLTKPLSNPLTGAKSQWERAADLSIDKGYGRWKRSSPNVKS